MNEEKAITEVTPRASEVAVHFDSIRLQEMGKMAEAFHRAGCFGSDVKNPYQALVKIQAGFEMGIPPMEAMNSLYIVNGHITIYGVAMSKRLRTKGWTISYDDKPDSCTVTIKKGEEAYSYTANSGELTKSQAFKFAPKEKLRWHALSRLIRFHVPEVLDAGVSYLKEEIEDLDLPGVKVVEMPNGSAPSLSAEEIGKKVNAAKSVQELEGIVKIAVQSNLLKEEKKSLMVLVAKVKKSLEDLPGVKVEREKEIIEGDAVDAELSFIEDKDEKVRAPGQGEEKHWGKHPPKESLYWTPVKIAQFVAGLKTSTEIHGLKEELNRFYGDGLITESTWKSGIEDCKKKLIQITSEARKSEARKSEAQSELPNE